MEILSFICKDLATQKTVFLCINISTTVTHDAYYDDQYAHLTEKFQPKLCDFTPTGSFTTLQIFLEFRILYIL